MLLLHQLTDCTSSLYPVEFNRFKLNVFFFSKCLFLSEVLQWNSFFVTRFPFSYGWWMFCLTRWQSICLMCRKFLNRHFESKIKSCENDKLQSLVLLHFDTFNLYIFLCNYLICRRWKAIAQYNILAIGEQENKNREYNLRWVWCMYVLYLKHIWIHSQI